MQDESTQGTGSRSGFPGWAVAVMVVLGIAAGAGVYTGWKASAYAMDSHQSLSNDIQAIRQTEAKDLDGMQQRLAMSEKSNAQLQDDLNVVTKKLRITQGELKTAHEEAQQIRDDANQQIAAMDTEVKGQLSTKANTDDVKAVSGEVTGVRTDLDATKNDLQMARSEMGTLIAKNHDELSELRRLGERDYIEFTVDGRNKPEKVGNVIVELRSANPKKNQFNLALVVDDKRSEKKNRAVNEPIFFHAQGNRQAMELVVNQVEKNKIVGYLSIPKTSAQAAATGATGSK